MFYIALRFYNYASETTAKKGTGGESDEGEMNIVQLWVPEGHFNQSIYVFISFINGGSAENCYCANCWNMLETTKLLNTDFKGKFLCHEFFLSHFFWFLRLHFHEDTEGAFDWHLELTHSACTIGRSCLWIQRLYKVPLAVFWITWNRVGWVNRILHLSLPVPYLRY